MRRLPRCNHSARMTISPLRKIHSRGVVSLEVLWQLIAYPLEALANTT
jgi:hypothetical protein